MLGIRKRLAAALTPAGDEFGKWGLTNRPASGLDLIAGSPDRRIAGSPDRRIAGSPDRRIAGSPDRPTCARAASARSHG